MRLIGALAIVMGLVTAAAAEDWSEFIDHNPQKPVVSQPVQVAQPKPQRARPVAKQVAQKQRPVVGKAARPSRGRRK